MNSRLLSVVSLLLLATGCTRSREELVVYVSEDRLYAEPILRSFEKAYGATVTAVYGPADDTSAMLKRLIAERAAPKADVYWAKEPVTAERLKQEGIAAPFIAPSAQGIAAEYKDPDGYWTGFAARARVILARTGIEPRPEGLDAYTDPKHAVRGVIAHPATSATSMQLAALFLEWGDAKTKNFLHASKSNGVRFAHSAADSARMIVAGTADFALVDSETATGRARESRAVEMIYPDQRDGEPGVLIIPDTAVLIRGARNAPTARRLIEDLLSRETERRMAFDDCARIPLHSDVETPPDTRRIIALRTMKVNYADIARKMKEIEPALKDWAGNQ